MTVKRPLFLRSKVTSGRIFFILLFSLVAICACSSQSPEEQVQAFLNTAVKEAENKSARGLKKLVAPTYEDELGLKPEDLRQIAAGYFFRKPNVFVKIRIGDISFSQDGSTADVWLIAALSTQPMEEELQLLQANFHDFRLALIYDDKWLLQSLQWKRVKVDDFLSLE